MDAILMQAIEEIQNAPCGDSWIEIRGVTYETDVGYAMDGIRILVDVCEKIEDEYYRGARRQIEAKEI